MFAGTYPVGAPEVYIAEPELRCAPAKEAWYGFAKCTVLPPRGMHVPVLPYRTPGKRLLFPLCNAAPSLLAPPFQHMAG